MDLSTFFWTSAFIGCGFSSFSDLEKNPNIDFFSSGFAVALDFALSAVFLAPKIPPNIPPPLLGSFLSDWIVGVGFCSFTLVEGFPLINSDEESFTLETSGLLKVGAFAFFLIELALTVLLLSSSDSLSEELDDFLPFLFESVSEDSEVTDFWGFLTSFGCIFWATFSWGFGFRFIEPNLTVLSSSDSLSEEDSFPMVFSS